LLIILKDEKREDLQCLCGLISIGAKKRGIKLLSDQNMLTDGIKKYVAKFNEGEISR
jgi:hypothetical protein